MAELPMQMVLAGGGRLQPIFHVSDSPCLEICLCSGSSAIKSRSFCKLADRDEWVSLALEKDEAGAQAVNCVAPVSPVPSGR